MLPPLARRLDEIGPAAGRVLATIDAYVFGFTLQEVSLPASEGEAIQDLTEDLLATMADDFPHLSRFATEVVRGDPDYAFAREFEPGLGLVLDGLAALGDQNVS